MNAFPSAQPPSSWRLALRTLEPALPWLELAFIGVVALVYVVFRRTLAFRLEFIGPIALVAALYIVLVASAGVRRPKDFGLRREGLPEATRWTLALFGGPLLVLIGYGIWKGATLPAHFFYTLALYPLWGLLQQLVFQGFVLENLRRLGLGPWSIPVAALFYASVHWPSPFMLWATGVAGLGFSFVYYRFRNVLPLGVAHGILGACLFYLYLGRDPFAKFIA
ncbi:MAG: CPBP family intramembrane metalloprotease [Verrucomicrobia bacterium]|nr:CPBP family intramembrane metalloprotease [Verrucomicrobiota bacterium]